MKQVINNYVYPRNPLEHFDVYWAGRGKSEDNNLGNKTYRRLVDEKLYVFHSSDCKIRKCMIVDDIVQTLEGWGARFYHDPHHALVWTEIKERSTVLKKVRQALVDKKKKLIHLPNPTSNEDCSTSSLMQASLMTLTSDDAKCSSRNLSMVSIDSMMFQNDVYFGQNVENCNVNERYYQLISSYKTNFNSALSDRHRNMIARDIVSKLEKLEARFFSASEGNVDGEEWLELDQNDLLIQVYTDLLDDDDMMIETTKRASISTSVSTPIISRGDPRNYANQIKYPHSTPTLLSPGSSVTNTSPEKCFDTRNVNGNDRSNEVLYCPPFYNNDTWIKDNSTNSVYHHNGNNLHHISNFLDAAPLTGGIKSRASALPYLQDENDKYLCNHTFPPDYQQHLLEKNYRGSILDDHGDLQPSFSNVSNAMFDTSRAHSASAPPSLPPLQIIDIDFARQQTDVSHDQKSMVVDLTQDVLENEENPENPQ